METELSLEQAIERALALYDMRPDTRTEAEQKRAIRLVADVARRDEAECIRGLIFEHGPDCVFCERVDTWDTEIRLKLDSEQVSESPDPPARLLAEEGA